MSNLSPDQVIENELICEKLLGWKRIDATPTHRAYWRSPSGGEWLNTPIFTDWAQAGLILDALKAADCIVSISFAAKGGYCAINSVSSDAKPLQLAIRAAALKYIQEMKLWKL